MRKEWGINAMLQETQDFGCLLSGSLNSLFLQGKTWGQKWVYSNPSKLHQIRVDNNG
ncbi:MAG: hypothetical protein VYC71_04855 [Planctomycetota bacterium]|nr:hypothetical protein [Planctomycetota bacterium]